MPIYAYRCGACGHSQDFLQKLSDPVLTTCPACGAEALAKQVTAAGFQLKGSGWYVTDFRGDSKGAKKPDDKPTEASGDAAAKSETKAETKGDSKADTKSDAKSDSAAAAPAPAPASPPPASGS